MRVFCPLPALLAALCLLAMAAPQAQPQLGLTQPGEQAELIGEALHLEDVDFLYLPGGGLQIELGFSGPPPAPELLLIDHPPRLSLDFQAVSNRLGRRRYELGDGGAQRALLLEVQGRTRLVVDLREARLPDYRIEGRRLTLLLGPDPDRTATRPGLAGGLLAAAPDGGNAGLPDEAGEPPLRAQQGDILGIDFRRGEEGAGEVVIDLGRPDLVADLSRDGGRLELRFPGARLDPDLQQRLDVRDFATPVSSIELLAESAAVRLVAQADGEFDYLGYQSAGQYVLSISPLVAAAAANAPSFSGEPISLNLQDIAVRDLLYQLADFAGFSLVVGDAVTGNITMNLDEVPWDQALDLVLRVRGLAQRRTGSVIYVAPAEEIASAELRALENERQALSLAPVLLEYIPVNYAVANDLLTLLSGPEPDGGVLSPRGRAAVDLRSNTLIVQDVEANLAQVRELIARLDVPMRQVLIEARIVNAATNFSKTLGIRWGGAYNVPGAGDRIILGGSQSGVSGFSSGLAAYDLALNQALAAGLSPQEALATTPRPIPAIGDNLVVDLGTPDPASSFALGILSDDGLLSLELSALEASGKGEVIAQPKVATQDQHLARIESGVQVPYQAQAGGTAGGSTTEFIPAVLSLEVTPQITPDNRIIMLLDIHQDSVVQGAGAVPAISTNSVSTRVLVNDGQTVVLGGVFREEFSTTVSKTPLLGDLPYLGRLFKRSENTETKTELLIFITPSILGELR